MLSKLFSFDFVRNRKKFYILSIAITLLGIVSLFTIGLNRGVDFKAGTTIDITSNVPLDKDKVMQIFTETGLEPPAAPTFGGDRSERVTIRYDKVLVKEEVDRLIGGFKAAYGNELAHEENTVDTEMANELARKAILAIVMAGIGIVIYIAIRFEWRFGIAAIVTLFYDAFIVIALFSIFQWEVNLPFVAAVLTVIGYSINDKIVIFDRIRENMRFAKLKNFDDVASLVNQSIWQTMSRSINTILTILFAAICLYIFGSQSIKLFSLAMIIGLVSGAYSSIFIASPLWLQFKVKSLSSVKRLTAAKE